MDKVVLIYDGKEESFVPLHAQNILNIQHEKQIPGKDCWMLPEDSPWQFVEGILSLKPKKRANDNAGSDRTVTKPRK